MRFYKLTYNAITRIEKRTNNGKESFEDLFKDIPDEISELTNGNVVAFLSDYSSKKIHIAVAVNNGEIDGYIEDITSFLPSNISDENKAEEITGENFDKMTRCADRFCSICGSEIREKLGIYNLYSWNSELSFDEQFIEKPKGEYFSLELDDEKERIRQSGKPKIEYNPVHYIIGGNSPESRETLLEKLLFELKENGRISQARYTMIHIKDCHHFNLKAMSAEAEIIFKVSAGGAVVFNIADTISGGEEKRSSVREVLSALCKVSKKYLRNTLCIFLLPDNNHASADEMRACMPGETFVEIREDYINFEKSRKYLSFLAKNDRVRANKALYKDIEKDKTYFIDELNAVYNNWYKKSVIDKSFPAYSKYYEKHAVKVEKAEEKKERGDAYKELMSMIGLAGAKEVINEAIDYFRAQKLFADCGFAGSSPTMHMVFTGSPGTAKTTAARLFAKIMRDNNILSKGTFVEVGRADLVGMYVGWTANIVKEKFRKAEGGVLFIDEAYSLVDDRGGSYGDEAINTIVQEMENNRNDTIVIFAGYSDKMEEFLGKNPGLRSRIAFHVPFEDYSAEELFEIAELMSEKNKTVFAPGVKEKMIPIFKAASLQPDFGNGRFVRNLMEKARMKQATRLVNSGKKLITREQVSTLIPEDFEMPIMCTAKEIKRNAIGF